MRALITIDTMYLSVKYPKDDVFRMWYKNVDMMDPRKLKAGIPIREFVIRGGGSGYKISLWQNDARVFLTDFVDSNCGDGNGMGIWVQLGPKFIIEHIENLHQAVNDLLMAIGVYGNYPIRITRIDVALDLFDVPMNTQNVNTWNLGWVGRSKPSKFIFNSRTGELETIYVGARQSPIYLRIYDKIAQAFSEGDLPYWVDVWKEDCTDVMRIEWEVKPNDGNFTKELKDFKYFTGQTVQELLIYLLDWGRLAIPDDKDSNRTRWVDSSLWLIVRKAIVKWAEEGTWPISRYGKKFFGVSNRYIKQLSGNISGGMAKLNRENPSLENLLEGLRKNGERLEDIENKATKKAEILKRL